MRVTTRLIEGEFPNYRQLVPAATPTAWWWARTPLLDAVRRVKLLAREATPIRMALRPDGLELTAVTHDVGQAREDLDAKYEGSEMVVAFNPEFLIDGVEATPATKSSSRPSTPSSRPPCGPPRARTSCTCSCRYGSPRHAGAAPRDLWLDRLPQLRARPS